MSKLHCRLSILGVCLLAGLLLGVAGCERIAPVRTLPSWVRGIYIPIFKNKSFEPAIEENVTRLTQEAFLADGRLAVVRKEDADLTLVGEVLEWTPTSSGTRGDRISDSERVKVLVGLKLYEPYNDTEPFADLGTVLVNMNFDTDTRSVRYEAEPDRKDELLNQVARMIVMKTISGFPQTISGGMAGPAPKQPINPDEVTERDILRPRPGAMR